MKMYIEDAAEYYKGGCLPSSVVGGIYEENASYKWKIVVLPFKNMADEEVRKCFN